MVQRQVAVKKRSKDIARRDYQVQYYKPVKKMANGCQLDTEMPDKLLEPDELEVFIDGLCRKYANATIK